MAQAGRKPKSAKLKVLEGNPGKRPIKNEPDPGGDLGEAPERLGEEGRRFYNDAAELIDRMGMAAETDRKLLEALAELWDQFCEARRMRAEHGDYQFHEKKGRWVKHPWTVTIQQNADKLRIGFNEIGFTPSARARLIAPEAKDADDERMFGAA